MSTEHVTAERLERIAFRTGAEISMGGQHPTLTDGGTTYVADLVPEAAEESEVIRSDRQEERSLRDAEDLGGYRRVGGRLYDTSDLPSGDEL